MPTNSATGNIPYAVLKDLHKNYLADKHKILSDAMGKEDTKSIWFELNDTFRNFLKEILNDQKVSGIRLYEIQYPAEQITVDERLIPGDKDDVNKLSIGWVATTNDGEKKPDYPISVSGLNMSLNHGELCPSACSAQ